ncbi:MAG: hypothetical protein JXB50_12040 [Spirochaetes bacterium]|nr:hypothetical protein [Spirochaetota bacterium]
MFYLIIVFTVIYSAINIIRLTINYKNRELIINSYPEKYKAKWESVYRNPVLFILKFTVIRIAGMIVVLFILPMQLEYSYENNFYKIIIGLLFYISFVTIFEEARALIGLKIMLRKIKEDKIKEPDFKEIYYSLLIMFQYILLIGLIPLLFILNDFSAVNIGMLISGIIYILYNLNKLIYAKTNFKRLLKAD